jgi:hypothetical protein
MAVVSSPPAVTCEPSLLTLTAPGCAGVAVFRLSCQALEPPVVRLFSPEGGREEIPMARDPGDGYYAAVRKSAGEYYYHFLVDGFIAFDPCATGAVTFLDGMPVHTLRVDDGAGIVTFRNTGAFEFAGGFQSDPPIVEVEPSQLQIPAGGAADVLLRPTFSEAAWDRDARVTLVHRYTKRVEAGCEAHIRSVPPAPSLSVEPSIESDGGIRLRMVVQGAGRITCHVLDRTGPRLQRFELGTDLFGHTETSYRTGAVSKGLCDALRGAPVVTVFSDSPFAGERYGEGHFTDSSRLVFRMGCTP